MREPATPRVEKVKAAESPAPLIPEVAERWSPRSFSDRPLTGVELRTLLEAARWAPSSYNEQPWHFLVARKEDEAAFQRMLECLNEKNREWAREAAVLMLTVTREHFSRNGKENRHAFHDVGLAMGQLLAQATAMDLHVHQMAGIRPDHAAEVYDIPDGHQVVAGVALGHLGKVEVDESDTRSRRPLEEFVFQERWGEPAPFLERTGGS